MITLIYRVTIGLLLVALGYQLQKNPATMTIGTYGVFIVLSVILLCQHWLNLSPASRQAIRVCSYSVAILMGVILMLSIAWYSWKKSRRVLVSGIIGGYLISLVLLSPWSLWRMAAPGLLFYFVWQFSRF